MLQRLLPFPQCSHFVFRESSACSEQAFDSGKAPAERARGPVETTLGPTHAQWEPFDPNTRENGEGLACLYRSTAGSGSDPATFG